MLERLTPDGWRDALVHVKQKHKEFNHELSPVKELLIPEFRIATISGHPGTGKTVIAESLAARMGVDFVKVGDLFREVVRQEQGIEVIGYVPRSDETDIQLDEMQREIVRHARELERPVILEGRLAAVDATEILDTLDPQEAPLVVRILFYANNRERYKRILDRENDKIPPGTRLITLAEIRRQTIDREQKDLAQYRKFHPILTEYHGVKVDSPFNPHLIDKRTRKHIFYDVVINTTHRSQEETEDALVYELVKLGYARHELPTQQPTTSLPPSGDIFLGM